MPSLTSDSKTKFQQLVEKYENLLVEGGFPPIAPITSPSGGGGSTGAAPTSAVDQVIEGDPNVAAAKKKAADAVALQLKQRAGTITNP